MAPIEGPPAFGPPAPAPGSAAVLGAGAAASVPAAPPPAAPAPMPAVPPGAPDASAGMPPLGQWPTAAGTRAGDRESFALPMHGPSRRTMLIAAVCIGLTGIGVGAALAWQALRRKPEAPTQVPETSVALVELPHQVGGDAGTADAEAAPGGAGAQAGGSGRGGRSASVANRARAGDDDDAPRTGARTQAAGGGQGGGSNGGGGSGSGGGGRAASGSSSGSAAVAAGGGSAAGSGGGSAGGGGQTSDARDRTREDAPRETAGGGIGPGEPTDPGLRPRGPSVGGYTQGEQTDATGTMDPRVFTFVYRRYRSQIASCHSNVSRMREVVGTMRVRIRLGTDGRVARTRVMEDTTDEPALATCVQNTIRQWRYPQPEGGEVEFEYRLAFGN